MSATFRLGEVITDGEPIGFATYEIESVEGIEGEIEVKGPLCEQTAAFIVRAANSHEALVKALTASLCAMSIARAIPPVNEEYDFGEAIKAARAALKLAGAE